MTLILALLTGFVFYQLENLPFRVFGVGTAKMEDWADKVRGAFVALSGMQPQVKINERVVYEQTTSVLELAVAERDLEVERETEDTWLGSTKRLRVRGSFRVKAGYDLTMPFSVQITDKSPSTVAIQMPPPRILSVEQLGVEVMTQENGLWNHMQPEEYAQTVNELNNEARLKAVQAGLIEEAKQRFADQLTSKLGPKFGSEIFFGPALVPPAKSTPKP